MSAQVPTKIVLKSTTKMSLNDRFTSIQQRAQPTVQNIRSNMVAQQQASAANRRLAQQLANRPGVNMNPYQGGGGGGGGVGGGLMDMGSMGMGGMPPPQQQQQRSLKQRLGRGNIKARLNLDAVGRGGPPMGMRGRGHSPVNFNNRGGFRGGRGQGSPMQPMRGRGGRGALRGTNTFFRGQQGGRGRGMMRGNFNRTSMRGGPVAGGPPRGGSRGGFRGQGMRGRGRGGAMRGGRGRGRGGNNKEGGVSREQLDNQLDEYMSKTKSHLDAELDTYMAEANP
ncbi:uncharacterized protein LOC143277739 isoform X2 [Babylonia areolata]|uniref:uncharacterized protein LOC143277739 isoform X2 n=1 Tax=Babylonia areolata TaxID=304850 RepID=UPI003FCF7B00